MRRLAAPYTLTPQGLQRNRIVEIADNGTILAISECANPDRMERVEWYNGIIIPAMVNAHCHLELSYMAGKITPHGGFSGFARGLRAVRGSVSATEQMAAAAWRDSAMWSAGVQAVGDVCNDALTFEVKSRSNILYHNFVELYGLGHRTARSAQLVLEQALAMGLRADIAPHSLYSLRDEAYTAATAANRLSLHFAESDEEVDLFSCRGAMWEWYQSAGFEAPFVGQYPSPTDRLLALTPPDKQMVLIHACRVTREDVERINNHFTTPPVWVVCPMSNDFISRLTPPVDILRECGARVAVGTDSLASNTDLSMIAELRAMPSVPLAERLVWATEGGAAALGLSDQLGHLAVGTRPGIALVEGVDYDTLQLRPTASSRRLI